MKALQAWIFTFPMVMAWCMSSCSDEDHMTMQQPDKQEWTVAVLMGEEEQARWERTAQWALENINKARGNAQPSEA